MATIALPALTRSRWKSAFLGTLRALLATYRLGGRTFGAAPLIVAVAVTPEALQHVAEIKLGMFASREAAHALSNDATRWAFGYVKIAGFVAAILLTARFWATGSVRRALLIPPRDLLRTAVLLLFLLGLGAALQWVEGLVKHPLAASLIAALNLASQTLLFVPFVAALLGARNFRWPGDLWAKLPTALLITLLGAAAFLPLQALHTGNHLLAFGKPAALVWGLMLFDSLVVGLLAASVGAALYVGYRSGPSWRGWNVPPGDIG